MPTASNKNVKWKSDASLESLAELSTQLSSLLSVQQNFSTSLDTIGDNDLDWGSASTGTFVPREPTFKKSSSRRQKMSLQQQKQELMQVKAVISDNFFAAIREEVDSALEHSSAMGDILQSGFTHVPEEDDHYGDRNMPHIPQLCNKPGINLALFNLRKALLSKYMLLADVFDIFDYNKDGFLAYSEFKKGLERSGIPWQILTGLPSLQPVFEVLDVSGQGKLTLREWVRRTSEDPTEPETDSQRAVDDVHSDDCLLSPKPAWSRAKPDRDTKHGYHLFSASMQADTLPARKKSDAPVAIGRNIRRTQEFMEQKQQKLQDAEEEREQAEYSQMKEPRITMKSRKIHTKNAEKGFATSLRKDPLRKTPAKEKQLERIAQRLEAAESAETKDHTFRPETNKKSALLYETITRDHDKKDIGARLHEGRSFKLMSTNVRKYRGDPNETFHPKISKRAHRFTRSSSATKSGTASSVSQRLYSDGLDATKLPWKDQRWVEDGISFEGMSASQKLFRFLDTGGEVVSSKEAHMPQSDWNEMQSGRAQGSRSNTNSPREAEPQNQASERRYTPENMNDAASKIQAVYRGRDERRKVASRVQSQKSLQEKKERNAAALKMQSTFRGHTARQSVRHIRSEYSQDAIREMEDQRRINEKQEDERKRAAVKIQSLSRGNRTRRELNGAKAVAEHINAKSLADTAPVEESTSAAEAAPVPTAEADAGPVEGTAPLAEPPKEAEEAAAQPAAAEVREQAGEDQNDF